MSDVAIRVENLGKLYHIGGPQARYKTIRESIQDGLKAPFRRAGRLLSGQAHGAAELDKTIWALKDVSFEVKQGEVIGIIGRNGAGKSTLLKILSRITEPTEGEVMLRGRVGSLLEVGTGFHPELTGRENIYLNGAILGMKREEIDRKFDEMVNFSGIEQFIDTPVKHYSSGMYVRLAFSVAAHLDPEILLVDEVLAVGDTAFQKKCLGKIEDVSTSGRTVMLVSHNLSSIENLCRSSILLNDGIVIRHGNTLQVVGEYLQRILPNSIERTPLDKRKDRSGNGLIRLVSFHLEDKNKFLVSAARSGEKITLVFGYECVKGFIPKRVEVGFSVHSMDGRALFVLYNSYVGQTFDQVTGSGTFRCILPNVPLRSGRYLVGGRVLSKGEETDWPQNGIGYLDVEGGDFYDTGFAGFGDAAPFLVRGVWTVEPIK